MLRTILLEKLKGDFYTSIENLSRKKEEKKKESVKKLIVSMYSDDESFVSSHSRASEELHCIAREQAGARRANLQASASVDPAPIVEEDDNSGSDSRGTDAADVDGAFQGVVEESSVPLACLERCAIFVDAALFDPLSPAGDVNECLVECSMAVVEYPFCCPTAARTKTLIHMPVMSTNKMTKLLRATTVQRWEHLLTAQHGIPCLPHGVSTGFDEFLTMVDVFRAYLNNYRHVLSGSDGNGDGTGAHMTVALNEDDLYMKMRDTLFNTLNDAVQVWEAEESRTEVAFLTTANRLEEVRRCLLWLQTKTEISFPRYQVFTVEKVLGTDWGNLVTREQEHCSCGYHAYLMTNAYGNRRHCCEGVVTAMLRVMEAAVRNMEQQLLAEKKKQKEQKEKEKQKSQEKSKENHKEKKK